MAHNIFFKVGAQPGTGLRARSVQLGAQFAVDNKRLYGSHEAAMKASARSERPRRFLYEHAFCSYAGGRRRAAGHHQCVEKYLFAARPDSQ